MTDDEFLDHAAIQIYAAYVLTPDHDDTDYDRAWREARMLLAKRKPPYTIKNGLQVRVK